MRREKRQREAQNRRPSTARRKPGATRKSRERDNKDSTITVGDDVRIPQTDIVLEKGDEIRIFPKEPSKSNRESKPSPRRKKEAVMNRSEDMELAIKRAFREEMDVDEVEVEEESSYGRITYFAVESESGSASNGEREWMVFTDIDDAESFAIEDVRRMLEDEPELFNQDFLSRYIYISDTDRRQIAIDESSDMVDDVMDTDDVLERAGLDEEYEDNEEQLKELEDQLESLDNEYDNAESDEEKSSIEDQMNEVEGKIERLNQNQEGILIRARDDAMEAIYNEVYQALEDPIQYFIEDNGMYGNVGELMEQPFILINIDEAAEEAVNVDGIAHFLDSYDGEHEEISDPETGTEFFVYGTN